MHFHWCPPWSFLPRLGSGLVPFMCSYTCHFLSVIITVRFNSLSCWMCLCCCESLFYFKRRNQRQMSTALDNKANLIEIITRSQWHYTRPGRVCGLRFALRQTLNKANKVFSILRWRRVFGPVRVLNIEAALIAEAFSASRRQLNPHVWSYSTTLQER